MEQKKDFLDDLAQKVMVVAILIAFVCTLLSVIFQFISADTATLFTQLSFYAYGWMVFVALGPAVKRGMFMKVELISGKYPEGTQKALKLICDVIMFILIAVMFVYSCMNFASALAAGEMNASAPVIPVALAYLASMLGFGLGVIAYIVRTLASKGGNK